MAQSPLSDRYLVRPKSKVNLSRIDPDDAGPKPLSKDKGKEAFTKLNCQVEELQERLYAEHKHKVLVVLQATDSGGKDGTIRHVFNKVNPQGVRVASFKKPTDEELDHDYLWRVHQEAPAKGEIVIFNRSHYEDVLIVRVHNFVPKSVWSKRFDHINAFEKMLADEGTLIIKFFLHISHEEQRNRILARLDDPTKHWKFNPADLDERKKWDDYQNAYADCISKTSTPWAPWYIIPANRKWYRNLLISSILVEKLKSLKIEYPQPTFDPATVSREF